MDAREFRPDEQRIFDWNRIVIVVFTRLVYRKGIDLLAVLLPAICYRHPNVNFLICNRYGYIPTVETLLLRWRWTQEEAAGRSDLEGRAE